MNKIRKLFKYWLPPFSLALLIFYLSSLSIPEASQIYWKDFIVKKSAHVIEYGLLSTLLYRAFKNSNVEKKKSGILAVVISVIYAFTDEFHQSFVPGREPRLRDVVFDTIGASLAIYLIWNLLPKTQGRLKNLVKKLQLI